MAGSGGIISACLWCFFFWKVINLICITKYITTPTNLNFTDTTYNGKENMVLMVLRPCWADV